MVSGTPGKHITPQSSAQSAARLTMRKRLRALENAMERAHACDPAKEKAIHRLRVATRRAGATLRSFTDIVPPEHASPLKKRLRKIRRAAGPARIADVHIRRFQSWYREAPPALQPPIAYILGRLREERFADQHAVDNATDSTSIDRIRSLRKDLDIALRRAAKSSDIPSISCADFAAHALQSLLHRAQEVSRRLSTLDELHEFRIEGKRLRYAVETFAPALPDHAEEALDRLTTLQNHLGDLNDARELLERVQHYLAQAQHHDLEQTLVDSLAIVEHGLARRLDATRDAFLQWWGERGSHWLLAPIRNACAQIRHDPTPSKPSGRIDADHERAAG